MQKKSGAKGWAGFEADAGGGFVQILVHKALVSGGREFFVCRNRTLNGDFELRGCDRKSDLCLGNMPSSKSSMHPGKKDQIPEII